ncbi:MAG: transcription factor IIA subunit alpha [Sclerophora amabilis]|nr:MAG: transcription factor IIA subunit alpha [Sclerophora amabilis]
MSNQLVGSIYQRIMQEVLESSRVDFEEGGVEQSMLEELREGWQQKVSSLNVAQFPWDPPPAPPQITNPPTVPSNAHAQKPAQPAPDSTPPSPPPGPSSNVGGVRIKAEPGYEASQSTSGVSSPNPHGHPMNSALNNPQTAAQRAANLMQQKFGNQASNSIGALQSGLVLPGARAGAQSSGQQAQSQSPQAQQGAQGSQQQQGHPGSQQAQGQEGSLPKQEQHRNATGGLDTDGAGDDADDEWSGVIVRRNAQGDQEELGRVEIDGMIRQRVEEMGQRMEGGGLMLPLREHHKASHSKKKRRAGARHQSAGSAGAPKSALAPVVPATAPSSSMHVSRYDGGDSLDSDDEPAVGLKDEDDADAINSDLDDPEENLDENPEEDEQLSPIMLCMYDKVQRVKNKWKCVLKDGVLSVNGREYVFHKATGEFEW